MLRLCARPASGTHAPLSMTGQKELGQTWEFRKKAKKFLDAGEQSIPKKGDM